MILEVKFSHPDTDAGRKPVDKVIEFLGLDKEELVQDCSEVDYNPNTGIIYSHKVNLKFRLDEKQFVEEN